MRFRRSALIARIVFLDPIDRDAGTQMNCREVEYGSDEYRETIDLRDRILRRPLGLETSDGELAADQRCLHVGCWDQGHLVACLVLEPLADGQIKMRQVAVDTDYQRQGIGTVLVEFSETLAVERGFHEMLMHARDLAVPFYERLGYSKQGEPFLEVTIPHLTMCKLLTPRP